MMEVAARSFHCSSPLLSNLHHHQLHHRHSHRLNQPLFTRFSCKSHGSPLFSPHDATLLRRSPFFPSPSFSGYLVRAESEAASGSVTTDSVGVFKKVLLPIIDRNPYLSEATRQTAATATALAKKYGAEITVVVIDEDDKESVAEHELRLKNIRWHLAEGGFEEFGLMERFGEGKRQAAVIGEVADDLSLDLVVLSMEAIHSKHIDANLLAEFVPCPILLLPL